MTPEDFTIEDLLADAQASGATPAATVGGLRQWRDDLLQVGRTKDPETYWKGSMQLDQDLAPVLANLREQEGVRTLRESLPDEQNRAVFSKQYADAGGDPEQMNPAFKDVAARLNALSTDKSFELPASPTILTLSTDDGKPLADAVVRGGEALIRPLKEGGKPFIIPLKEYTREELNTLADEADAVVAGREEAGKRLTEMMPLTGTVFNKEAQDKLAADLSDDQAAAATYRSGDPVALATLEIGKALKGDEKLLAQVADKDLADRFETGVLRATINTSRAFLDIGDQYRLKDPNDRFAGFEEALTTLNEDTARSFRATQGDKVLAAAAESAGQMAPTLVPYGLAMRGAGLISKGATAATELGAAASMAPSSYGGELGQMLESAEAAEEAGDTARANQLRSVARWSSLAQAAIDTGTEMIFPESSALIRGGAGAAKRLATGSFKGGLEEVAAGTLERGLKEPAFYPEDMQASSLGEGAMTEFAAGTLGTASIQGVVEGPRIVRDVMGGTKARLAKARETALANAPDAGTAGKLNQVFDAADAWASFDLPEESTPGVGDVTAPSGVVTPPAPASPQVGSPPTALTTQESVAPPVATELPGLAPEGRSVEGLPQAPPPVETVEAPTGVVPKVFRSKEAPGELAPTIQGVHYSREPLQLTDTPPEGNPDNVFGDGLYAAEPQDVEMWRKMDRLVLGENRNELSFTPQNPLVVTPDNITGLIEKSGALEKEYPERAFDKWLSEQVRNGSHDALVIRGFAEDMGSPLKVVEKRVREIWKPQFLEGRTNGTFTNVEEFEAARKQAHNELFGMTPEVFDIFTNQQNQIFVPPNKVGIVKTTNPAPVEQALGGVDDLGASTEGPATGSSAPVVSEQQVAPVPTTVNDLATSTVKAPVNVDPAAFRARQKAAPQPTIDLPYLKELAAKTTGESSLRTELQAYTPEERAEIARSIGTQDTSPAALAKALRYQEQGTTRFSLGSDTPTGGMTEAQARAALAGQVPSALTFINDPTARTPWGKPWAGKADRATGKVQINLAYIQNAEDLKARVKEEMLHLVWQDPAVKAAVADLEAAITPGMREEMARLGYEPGMQTEEAATRLVDKITRTPDARSAWRRLLDAVRNAFRRLFRMEPDARQVEAAAHEVLRYAMSERPAPGQGTAYSTFEQVFGQQEVGDVKPIRRVADARSVVKQSYFDGAAPVTPENTAAALSLAYEWQDPATGRDVAQRLIDAAAASGQETPDLMFGTAQGELHTYALKMARAGDTRLLAMMDLTSNRWEVTGRNESLGFSKIGAILAGRQAYSPNAVNAAMKEVGRARRKAATANMPEEMVDAVEETVLNTKLEESPTRQVKRTVKDAKGKTLEEKVEENVADKTAGSLLDRFATLSWAPKGKENAIRTLVRRALTLGPNAIMWDRVWMIQSLVDLGVTPELANQLTAVVAAEKQRQRGAVLARAQQRAQDNAQGLAEGEVGSLRGLEDALLSVPASQQYDPTWRYNTAVQYFSQLGLTQKQAEAAARLYSNEFGARLADAQANAIERLSEKAAPWQTELAKKPLEQRKKALSDLDKLIRAVRAGVTDPDTIWYNAVAKANGWKGFTHAQHARLGEIDELLSDPTVADYKKNALKTEVQDIVQRANLPPTLGDYVAASYAMSALSGLPTLFVQYSAPFSIARDYLIDLHTNPVVATRALLAAIDSLYNEALYAGKNDVYNHEVSENMKGELPALKDLFERGLKNLQSPNALVRARAYGQLFIGGQVFISRVLSSIDEGAIAASNIYKLSMFTQRELKALGWTRAQAGEVVVAALDTRNDSIGNLIASGMERNEATVAGNEKFRRTVYQALAAESPSMAEDVLRGSIMESFGMTGRRNDIGDVFGVKMDKVLDTEEGFLRWAVGMPKLLDMVKQWRAMGGWHSLMANLVFGFMVIPMRTAMWGSNFFGYGLIRYAIHKGRKAANKETFWKQSFGTRAQERQRLREALTSLAVMGASLALRANSGDDDENEAGFKFFITGKGPEDRVMKEAWMRQGFRPYSLVFKVGTAKFPINLGRIGESLAWTFGVAGVLDDIALKEKGKAARSKSLASYPMEFIGGYMGSLAARSAFQGVGRTWGLFDSRKSGDKITDEVMRQAAFSASSFAPWKGAMGSMTRLITTPVDNNTMAGVILSNMPVVGPVFGRPALNVLGDPIGDNTLSGKLYREGLPLIIRFPQDGPGARVYDLILEQGRGPSDPRQGEVEDRFGAITPEQFYNYSKERGRIIKEEMNTQYDRLRALDPKRFGDALERITRRANRRAAQAVGLSRSGGGT